MKAPKPKRLKKRLFRSWFTSAMSIALVLMLLGALLLIIINAGLLSDYVREQIGFTLVLDDNARDADIKRLEKRLQETDYVKSVQYIDKETAASELTDELGEDFIDFLGFNPLFASLDVKLFAAYTNPDSLLILEKQFLRYPHIKEVHYQKNLISAINENIRKISIILLVVSIFTGIIFFTLINNTIRISVYSERFTINTMQLVGAPRSFVRKPFLKRGVSLGIFGGFVAGLFLFATLFLFRKELSGIIEYSEIRLILPVFLILMLAGIVLSWISTRFAVNKFLKMKFDELFY